MAVHEHAGRVRYRIGATFGATSMVGASAGGHVSRCLPDGILIAAFTVVTGVMMLRKRRKVGAARCASARCTSVRGVSVGLLTGVVGAGGGFVVVPALAMLGGLPMPEAIATSLRS
jgi:uncharacterized membrane protein YfcA